MKKTILILLVILCTLMLRTAADAFADAADMAGNQLPEDRNETIVTVQEDLANAVAEIYNNIIGAIQHGQDLKPATQQENAPLFTTETYEVLGDYFLPHSYGSYANHVIVIRNVSDRTLDFTSTSQFYDVGGMQVAEENGWLRVLGPGSTSCIQESVYVGDETIDHWECSIDTESTPDYFVPVVQDLSWVLTETDGGVIVRVTNNGNNNANWPTGYSLFFRGDELVDTDFGFFDCSNYVLHPGESSYAKCSAYEAESFDRVEFYLQSDAYTDDVVVEIDYPDDEDAVLLQEYSLRERSNLYHFAVVKNVSDHTLDLDTTMVAAGPEGNLLDVGTDSCSAGPGQTVLLYGCFYGNESEIADIRTFLYVSPPYGTCLPDELSVLQTDVTNGVVFTVTNNSSETLEYLRGIALFFKDLVPVAWDYEYIGLNGNVLEPGKAASVILEPGQNYDTVEFYLR